MIVDLPEDVLRSRRSVKWGACPDDVLPAWIAEMEADANQRNRPADDEPDWSSLFSGGTNPIRAVFIALAIWFVWYFWPRG